jgi:PAS domain S-box-containing protein
MSSLSAISKVPIETALDRMVDGFVLMDPEFRIVYMNPAAERIWQTSFSEAAGRTHWEVWPNSADTELERRYRAAMAAGEAQHFEHRTAPNAVDLWLKIHAYPSEVGLTVNYRDVSERWRAQSEAARVERAYKAALSNTPDLVYVFDLDHRFTYANQALLTMWGRTWDDSIGKNCLELGYPEWHAAMHDREIDAVVKTRKPVRGVVPFTGTHGRRYYDYIFVPVIGVDGEVEAVAGTTRDVTERHEAEQELRRSEERFRLTQQAAHLAVWDLDLETGTIVWAPESAWLFGRPPQTMNTFEACLDAIHPDDRQAAWAAMRTNMQRTGEFSHTFRVVWPDGSVRWLSTRGKALASPEGQNVRLLGINADITAQREAEEVLRHEQRLLAEVFRQAPAFMAWMSGPEHVFKMVNPLYEELVGDRDVIGKPVRQVIPEVRDQGFLELLDRVYRTGEVFRAENLAVDLARGGSQDLERRYVTFVYQPMREADGSISGVIALGVDVTETMKAEEALRQNEKLAATGRLAASIAHEINNPLEAVTNLLYLLRQEPSLSPEACAWVSTAQSELARVSQIATQTLRFYRQSTKPAQTNIHEILDSVAALYELRLRSAEITLARRYSGHPEARVFEGELRQVVTNLLGNAVDAVPPGGRILLRQRRATDRRSGRPGIRVTVADTGHGIPREMQGRIFDPFFSTKGSLGTGLGLWITREIVHKHQGRIAVRSSVRPGRSGSVFALFLPDVAG